MLRNFSETLVTSETQSGYIVQAKKTILFEGIIWSTNLDYVVDKQL